MNTKEYREIIIKAFCDNGLDGILDENKAEKLKAFSDFLVDTNKKFNLTSITDEKEIILKHFIDCAAVLCYIPRGSTIIDVGCGAGFPSLPIAILREDVTVTALDSTEKKTSFINAVVQELFLNNITAVTSRAEDFSRLHRESFDISISRAVARMNILDELCLPLTKPGGYFIAMKSSRGEEEYREAQKGINLLGGVLHHNRKSTLSFEGEAIERELYVIKKQSATPPQYPRSYSQISKKPL